MIAEIMAASVTKFPAVKSGSSPGEDISRGTAVLFSAALVGGSKQVGLIYD